MLMMMMYTIGMGSVCCRSGGRRGVCGFIMFKQGIETIGYIITIQTNIKQDEVIHYLEYGTNKERIPNENTPVA